MRNKPQTRDSTSALATKADTFCDLFGDIAVPLLNLQAPPYPCTHHALLQLAHATVHSYQGSLAERHEDGSSSLFP